MKTIIVGTDFSLPAQNAVNYAVELAKHFDARLILTNSFSVPVGGYDTAAPFEMLALMQDASIKGLEDLKQEILKNNYYLRIECYSQTGTPYGVIKEAVTKYSADFIVMGMVGEGSFLKRHFFGSSAIAVAREMETPTFIIPELAKYSPIKNISFACDTEKLDEGNLLYRACEISEQFKAELEIVSVSSDKAELVLDKTEAHSYIERRLQGIKHKQVHIEDTNISTALEYYFKFHDADLIMVNPKKHTLFQKLFKESISKSLAFTVNTPMLFIH